MSQPALLGTRTCLALLARAKILSSPWNLPSYGPEREDPRHDRGDDLVRPKLVGQTRTVALVLERGLFDAAEKPAAETRPHQTRPVDLEDRSGCASGRTK